MKKLWKENEVFRLLILVCGAFLMIATLLWVFEERSGYADAAKWHKVNLGRV